MAVADRDSRALRGRRRRPPRRGRLLIRRLADPLAARGAFLAGLNACFPGWGGEAMFDWCFLRKVGAPAADLMVEERDGRIVAGSAVTYRRVRRGDGREEPMACMTGSWTLPEARGGGLFGQMTDLSVALAAERGCGLLAGYGARANASYPTLARRSAAVVEAAFLTAPAGDAGEAGTTRPADDAVQSFVGRVWAEGTARTLYSAEEWRGQMLGRPGGAVTLLMPNGVAVVIERRGEIDRLLDAATSATAVFLATVRLAAAASAAEGRRLSLYSVDPRVISALRGEGYEETPACFYQLSALGSPIPGERWHVANGDRM